MASSEGAIEAVTGILAMHAQRFLLAVRMMHEEREEFLEKCREVRSAGSRHAFIHVRFLVNKNPTQWVVEQPQSTDVRCIFG